MVHLSKEQLKSFILDSGLVTKADFEKAETEATKKELKVGDVLVGKGSLSEDDLRRIQANVLGIPFVDLKNTKIDVCNYK